MIKRPLFVAGIVFISMLCILYAAGIPGFGKPAEQAEVQACIGSGKSVTITGQVYRRVERANAIQYYINRAYLIHFSNFPYDSGGAPADLSDDAVQNQPGGIRINAGILVTTRQQDEILPGSAVEIEGKIDLVEEAKNPGQFDSASYYGAQGIFYSTWAEKFNTLQKGQGWRPAMERFRKTLSINLEKMLPNPHAGTLAAMLLGDKSMLDPETKINFQMGSLLHILSISGLHLTMLGMGLYRLLRRVRLPVWASVMSAMTFLSAYYVFTGQNVSTLRALVMFGAVLGARVTGRSYDALSSISLSLILLLFENHFNLFYSGFQLSFAAVTGAGVIYPLLQKSWGKKPVKSRTNKMKRWLRNNVLSCLAISLTVMPVVSFHFGEIPVLGLLSNLVVLPSLAGVIIPGVLGMVVGLFNLRLGAWILWLPRILLSFYETVARWLRHVPCVSWICGRPALWQCLVYYLLLAVAVWWVWGRNSRKKAGIRQWALHIAGLLLPLALGVSLLLWRRPVELSITVLDVGQGDGIVVRAGKYNMLVDGGSSDVKGVGQYRILPYIKSQGIRRIESIVITHPDADHVNGIQELLEAVARRETTFTIGRLFLPVWMHETSDEETFLQLAREAKVETAYLERGDSFQSGDMTVRILHPDKADYSSKGNEGSVTMEVSYGEFCGLLTGDLEGQAEKELTPFLGTCQFLKVGHHGSKNGSSQVFLEKVRPEIAVISCGIHNSYGHPGPDVVKRLEAVKSDCWYTMDSGAVRLEVRKNQMRVTGYLNAARAGFW